MLEIPVFHRPKGGPRELIRTILIERVSEKGPVVRYRVTHTNHVTGLTNERDFWFPRARDVVDFMVTKALQSLGFIGTG